MIKDVVAFEWRYHTRQASFIAAASIFFLFGFALTARAFGPANVNIDSPYSITQTVALLHFWYDGVVWSVTGDDRPWRRRSGRTSPSAKSAGSTERSETRRNR